MVTATKLDCSQDLMEALYSNTCSCVSVIQLVLQYVLTVVRWGCRITSDLFLSPVDLLTELLSMCGVNLEVFTKLYFANSVALHTECWRYLSLL